MCSGLDGVCGTLDELCGDSCGQAGKVILPVAPHAARAHVTRAGCRWLLRAGAHLHVHCDAHHLLREAPPVRLLPDLREVSKHRRVATVHARAPSTARNSVFFLIAWGAIIGRVRDGTVSRFSGVVSKEDINLAVVGACAVVGMGISALNAVILLLVRAAA